jgi:nitric oxide reductase NorD protein
MSIEMPKPRTVLTSEKIEDRLEEHVDAVLSSRRTAAGPAKRLASLSRARQEFVLYWVEAIAKTSSELAYQFADYAAQALNIMDTKSVETWALQAMDCYDKKGLTAGIGVLHKVQEFAAQSTALSSGLALEEVAGVLENFLIGLHGRRLKLEPSDEIYTDTETIFLPTLIHRFPTQQENFHLYKAIAVHHWAQTWYGTWRVDFDTLLTQFPNRQRALQLFYALETLRLDAHIARDLPGIYRHMLRLRARLDAKPLPPGWLKFNQQLQSSSAKANDCWELIALLDSGPLPRPCCYQGQLFPERVKAVLNERRQKDKHSFRVAIAKLRDELANKAPHTSETHPTASLDTQQVNQPHLSLRRIDADRPDGFTYEFLWDGRPVTPPEEARGVMASIMQDLGVIPEDYLVPAGPGAYSTESTSDKLDPNDVWKGTYHEEGALLYNEWDFARRHYRKNWCVLRERDVHPQHSHFVSTTLIKYSGLVKSLRRTFEILRGQDKLLKKQNHGEDVDIDALVEAFADVQSGREMTNRLFIKRHKEERDIAVMFMVDMSGSTKGWINEAEREALVLLCEALETLGDRYAIYGFSGMTRKRCELFRIKRFDEPYSDLVRARISGILPQDYTRMGVAIRHLSQLLNEVEARTKLLITLSDGKPDDYTGYRGEYGIEDTRQALFEARRDGIHPFCITIDDNAGEYLPHMYGAVNYVVINDVKKLPLKVSDIYRQLTT